MNKTKNIIILMITLFAVMLIGTTKVNAVEITDEVWKAIPDEISVNVKEIEYEKAPEMIKSQIIEILKGKGVTVSKEDVSVYIDDYKGVHNAKITIEENSKEVKVIYSNSANYNKNEKQKLDKIIAEWYKKNNVEIFENNGYSATFFAELGENSEKYWKQYDISTFLKEQGYEIISHGTMGGGGPLVSGSGNLHNIFKNDINYVAIVAEITRKTKITIPTDLEESKIPQYITDKINAIKDKLDFGGISKVNKVEKAKGSYYTVYYTEGESYETSEEVLVKREDNPIVTKEDIETGIKIQANKTFIVGMTYTVGKLTPKQEELCKHIMENNYIEKYVAYDMNLLQNGNKVQPNGKVKISIPIPDGYDKTKLEIYRIETDGTKIKYDVKVEGNYATFETNHFSIYVLAETKATTTNPTSPTTTAPTQQTTKREKDNTPKTGVADITKYIVAVTVMSAVGIIALKKKETK